MNRKQTVGRDGESRVIAYLKARGYTICARNVLLHQRGEIDIIAQKNEYLVCIEVKARYNTRMPFELLVPRSKQRKIITVARWFMQTRRITDKVVRFDVAFVDMTTEPIQIQYVENAFQA